MAVRVRGRSGAAVPFVGRRALAPHVPRLLRRHDAAAARAIASLAPSAWLDGLIVAVVTIAAGLAFYAQPVLDATDGDPVAVGVTMGYARWRCRAR